MLLLLPGCLAVRPPVFTVQAAQVALRDYGYHLSSLIYFAETIAALLWLLYSIIGKVDILLVFFLLGFLLVLRDRRQEMLNHRRICVGNIDMGDQNTQEMLHAAEWAVVKRSLIMGILMVPIFAIPVMVSLFLPTRLLKPNGILAKDRAIRKILFDHVLPMDH